jgi:adenosylmethionine-8-amino-7-oxononanoate aminotransferase
MNEYIVIDGETKGELKMSSIRNDFSKCREWDKRNVFHPWEGMERFGDDRDDRNFVETADGIYVFDEHGNKVIDGPAGMWCMQLGYGRVDLAEAMAEQAKKMAYCSPFSESNSVSAEFAHEIAKRAPGDLNTVYFTTCGSTAVDIAIRFVHFRNNLLGRPNKKKVISRQHAYHGGTYLSASLSGKPKERVWLDTADDICHFLPDVNPLHRAEGQSIEAFLDEKVEDLESAILELGPENVALFIAEPVLASGGVIVPPEGYHKRCLEICRKYDILYHSDEVVTGFGRCGHWFASEEVFGIQPDIITIAKGMTSGMVPMGAAVFSDRLLEGLAGELGAGKFFAAGYTYSGHPVCSAVGLKNIEAFEKEGVLEHVREITPYFQERLRALLKLPAVVDARGVGLIGCVECSVSRDGEVSKEINETLGEKFDAICKKLGLHLRPLGNLLVFSPPLVITIAQIDELFDILEEGITKGTEDLIADGYTVG